MELKDADTKEKTIGSAVKVRSKTDPGYPEILRARCPAVESDRIGLQCEKGKKPAVYCGGFTVGGRRVDFRVAQKTVAELKALPAFNGKDFVRALNHLRSHRQETALPVNSGAKSLRFKRLTGNKNIAVPTVPVNPVREPDAEYDPCALLKNTDNPFTNPDNPWS